VIQEDIPKEEEDFTKNLMRESLTHTSHSIREAKFKLSQIIDTGDFHIELKQGSPFKFYLH
jgi:hypothetical protein